MSEETDAYYHLLFEHISDGFTLNQVIRNSNGIPIDFILLNSNQKYEQFTGLPVSEMIHKSIREILPNVNEDYIQRFCEVTSTGKKLELTYYSEAFKKHIHVRAIKVNDEVFASLFTDVTSVVLQVQEKENMVRDLINQIQSLEQFAYIVSHNLRSPVTNIIGINHILQTNVNNEFDQSELIRKLDKSVCQLDIILSDLNDILRVKNEGFIDKKRIYFDSILQVVQDSLKSEILGFQVAIQADFEKCPDILSIKSYIHSIFLNLISNAIKYRHDKRRPVIQIRAIHSDFETILEFKDNGVGIDLTRYGHQLFGLYKRFHPNKDGRGMGLFMVKKQIEALGGSIEADSIPGEGTVFRICIPD